MACSVAKSSALAAIASYVFDKSLQMLKRISAPVIEGGCLDGLLSKTAAEVVLYCSSNLRLLL